MGEWMGGWVGEGCMDGWADVLMDGGWVDDGFVDGWVDVLMMDGWMGGWMNIVK